MFVATHYSKPQEKKPVCHFCNVTMVPLYLITKNYLTQRWKFKCPNRGIEFSEWV